MEQMPEYKEGFINMPKGGVWVSVPVAEIEAFINNTSEPKQTEEDTRGTENSLKLPAGT